MHLRLVQQLWIEELQLSADGRKVPNWVWAGAVDDMHKHTRALTVPQKLMA